MPTIVRRLNDSMYVLFDPARKRLIYLVGWNGNTAGLPRVSVKKKARLRHVIHSTPWLGQRPRVCHTYRAADHPDVNVRCLCAGEEAAGSGRGRAAAHVWPGAGAGGRCVRALPWWQALAVRGAAGAWRGPRRHGGGRDTGQASCSSVKVSGAGPEGPGRGGTLAVHAWHAMPCACLLLHERFAPDLP